MTADTIVTQQAWHEYGLHNIQLRWCYNIVTLLLITTREIITRHYLQTNKAYDGKMLTQPLVYYSVAHED